MIDCNICKHKENYCIECKHGELFERKNASKPKKISVRDGKEYCGHCGYLCDYARGYKKFYCIRCGGLNLRKWRDECFELVDVKATNADRIRNMSYDELAEFLAYNASCEECYVKKDDSCCYPDGTCKQKHLEWLQSEAE